MYSQRAKLKNRDNFNLEAPRELESMIDPTMHESIPSNSESPKSSKLHITTRKPNRSCKIYPTFKFGSYCLLDFIILPLIL